MATAKTDETALKAAETTVVEKPKKPVVKKTTQTTETTTLPQVEPQTSVAAPVTTLVSEPAKVSTPPAASEVQAPPVQISQVQAPPSTTPSSTQPERISIGEPRGYSQNRRPIHRGRRPGGDQPMHSRQMDRQPMQRTNYDMRGSVSEADSEVVAGMLDMRQDNSGILRSDYRYSDRETYISATQIRRANLRPGDMVSGPARRPKENERYWGLLRVDTVNDVPLAEVGKRRDFLRLTPVYPNERLILEIDTEPMANRLIDLVAPIGKGQRALVVSPPKAGKTTILKDIATGIARNHPDIHLMAVLIGERPEEVTDIGKHITAITGGKGEVAASNFDEPPNEQTRIGELALERAKRLVENGQDVVILLDSITRLARAYNLAIPTSGRTLSGGFDPAALYPPKRFFGAARNFEEKASLTIIGTALVDTGSRMDDLIYEEFKGTGNQELHLVRKFAERRIYPAIDVQRSGTRRDDLLYDSSTYQSIVLMHRMFDMLNEDERTEVLLQRLRKTKTNKAFLATLKEG